MPRLGALGLIDTIHNIFGVQPHILRGDGMGCEGMARVGRGEVAGRGALMSASLSRDIDNFLISGKEVFALMTYFAPTLLRKGTQ